MILAFYDQLFVGFLCGRLLVGIGDTDTDAYPNGDAFHVRDEFR